MAKYDFDLGIIGGGAAGLTAAAGAAQFGAKTILIEREGKLGGDCLHCGCVPSKALIHAAGLCSLIRNSKDFGLPEYQWQQVDLGAVMDRVKDIIEKIQEHDSPERFCALGAKVLFGNPVFTDDHMVAINGQIISAKNWIIATGSSPAVPSLPGLASIPYWTNQTVFDQRRLPARLIILGGGPVGLELGQAFVRLGSKVTIIEAMEQILGQEDKDVAAIIGKKLEDEGCTILTSTKALSVEYVQSVINLTIVNGGEEGQTRIIKADALLIGAGRRANVESLGLDAAGVSYTNRGIPTDLRMKTNISHIYACGDVNGQFPFTHVAGYEAGIALSNALLRLPRRADYEKIGWCTYTKPEVASIGLNEKRAMKNGVPYRVLEEQFTNNDRALIERLEDGKIKLLISPAGKFLGCQIIGAGAGELIHEWIIARNGNVRLSTVAGAVHIYPNLSEISKRVAGRLFAERLFSDGTKKILKFLFSLKGRACAPP